MTDRYAEAVRARRAELRAARAALSGTHRGEVRHELAMARLAAADVASTALRGLTREVRDRAETADRADRARLPGDVRTALTDIARAVDDVLTDDLLPALRRLAGVRGLRPGHGLPADWPALPPARAVRDEDVVDAFHGARVSLWAGTLEGIAVWRTALVPAALLPVLGLPLLAGPAFVPPVIGLALIGLVVAVRHRRAAADRSGLLRATAAAVGIVRGHLDADVARRLLELHHAAGPDLDEAVDRRRKVVDEQLRELAPGAAAHV